MSTKASIIFISQEETEDGQEVHMYREMMDGYIWLELRGRHTNINVRICHVDDFEKAKKKGFVHF